MATSTSNQLVLQTMTGTVHLARTWKGRTIPACSTGRTQVVVYPVDSVDEGEKLCKRCAAKMD